MRALVTVGTTKFDQLVLTTTSPMFVKFLTQLGFSSILIQYGSGKPPVLEMYNALTAVPYIENINHVLAQTQLVICHGGAGSILGALEHGCQVISVPNPSLLDNHQKELVGELSRWGLIEYAVNPYQLRTKIARIMQTKGSSFRPSPDFHHSPKSRAQNLIRILISERIGINLTRKITFSQTST